MAALSVGGVNRLFFQHEFGDGVVLVGDRLDQFRERGLGAFLMLGGNLADFVIQAFVDHVAFAKPETFLVDHVNEAGEFVFRADGQENRERIRLELVAHVGQRVFKIRAGAVHLVDERDARNMILGGLAPDGFRLRLHAGHAAEHGDRAVQHAHGALDFGGEIHVAGRVNDVDAVRHVLERLVNLAFARLGRLLRPEAGDGGGGDRDAALLFLLHPVGHGVAVIHVADLVDQAGVKEDALRGGRLAGVNVRGDADVAGAFEGVFAVGRIDRFGFSAHSFKIVTIIWSGNKKRPGDFRRGAVEKTFYQRKCAKALLACAIL